ncbi:conserved protein of unknown function (plasmid) [Shinella sp. WSC3-e]|nr:conserved protein of unknown function [Shinella sp. WSC3-e]
MPACTISPSFMMAMRSARRIASSKSWVMKTMVFFSTDCRRRNSSCISRRISGSSAEKGSSRNQSSGSAASERAMPTRCCWPPDSSRGKAFSRPVRPTRSIMRRARSSRAARSMPWISSGKATFASTVRCGSRAKCWKTMPIWWRRISIIRASLAASRFSPLKRMSPEVGSMRRERQRTSVDLPEPDRPMMTKISPSRTSILTSRTAPTAPAARRSALVSRAAEGPARDLPPAPKIFQTPRQTSFGSLEAIVIPVA